MAARPLEETNTRICSIPWCSTQLVLKYWGHFYKEAHPHPEGEERFPER